MLGNYTLGIFLGFNMIYISQFNGAFFCSIHDNYNTLSLIKFFKIVFAVCTISFSVICRANQEDVCQKENIITGIIYVKYYQFTRVMHT
jgi:hypothetical protein